MLFAITLCRRLFPVASRQRLAAPPVAALARRVYENGKRDCSMHDLRIALYQPDIPGNTGAILRLAACLGLAVDIIEPAGFDLSDRNLKRAGMDYLEMAALTRHVSWDAFEEWRRREKRRLILLTTRSDESYTRFSFDNSDVLLFGRESAGVPDHVHECADARLTFSMQPGARSLNLALSAAMVAGEAVRQISPPSADA